VFEELRRLFEERRIQRVKLGAFDIDCTLRGKYISLDKFWPAAESGTGFCDVIFGWDIGDALYDNAKVTGWHTGYPDASVRIDLESLRLIPWEPGTAFFLLDFVNAAAVSPRQVLQRALQRASAYKAMFSAEYEFFFFRETPHSLREKYYRNLTPLSPGAFGYSVLRASENSALTLQLFDDLAAFGVPLEGFRRSARRGRQGRPVQDSGQGDRRPPRLDSNFHGEMERRTAGLERAPSSEPLGSGQGAEPVCRRLGRHVSTNAKLHRGPGHASSGIGSHFLSYDQFL
jgi:hypothetical protein